MNLIMSENIYCINYANTCIQLLFLYCHPNQSEKVVSVVPCHHSSLQMKSFHPKVCTVDQHQHKVRAVKFTKIMLLPTLVIMWVGDQYSHCASITLKDLKVTHEPPVWTKFWVRLMHKIYNIKMKATWNEINSIQHRA